MRTFSLLALLVIGCGDIDEPKSTDDTGTAPADAGGGPDDPEDTGTPEDSASVDTSDAPDDTGDVASDTGDDTGDDTDDDTGDDTGDDTEDTPDDTGDSIETADTGASPEDTGTGPTITDLDEDGISAELDCDAERSPNHPESHRTAATATFWPRFACGCSFVQYYEMASGSPGT